MTKLTFKVTQKDGTILIYKPRQDVDCYSVAHFNPRTESTQLIQRITTKEAMDLFESYKVQKDVKVSIG